MNIGLLSNENGFDRGNAGGIGTYFACLAQMLAQRGHNVQAVTVHDAATSSSELAPGLTLHAIQRPEGAPWAQREQLSESFARTFATLQGDGLLDVVDMPDWLGFGHKIARNAEVASVTRLHTPLAWIQRFTGNDRTFADQSALLAREEQQIIASSLVVAPSQAMADVARSLWGVEATVLPNPLQVAPDHGRGAAADYDVRDRVILYLGRLEFRKGVHVLAKALPAVLKSHPHGRAILCGGDTPHNRRSMRAQLRDELGEVADQVSFVEHVTPEERARLIANADVLVVPSLWENFPYVALEALAAGTPVIASRAGGLVEIVQDGINGLLVEPDDPSALAAAMSAILDRSSVFGPEAIQATALPFQGANLVERYEDIYASAIRKHAAQEVIT